MLYLFLAFLVIVTLYVGIVLACLFGWKKSPQKSTNLSAAIQAVTVVIAVRNEENNLRALLQGLQQQTYADFEVLLINDHSDDNGKAVFTSFSDSRFKWINADEMGKKASLRKGIQLAKQGLILTTDADVVLPPTWIDSMVRLYSQTSAQLLIGPVTMSKGTIFQRIDYSSIEGVTHGSAQIGCPVLCSGANLAFSKVWYESCLPYLKPEIASGDDMFLLEATKRLGGKIVSTKAPEATVQISGCSSVQQLLAQRSRWASKAPRYSDVGICFVAVIVAFTQVACLTSLLLGAWYPLLFLVFLLKFVVDALLIGCVSCHHHTLRDMRYYPVVALVYPFYVLFVLLLTLFPNQWKKRTL